MFGCFILRAEKGYLGFINCNVGTMSADSNEHWCEKENCDVGVLLHQNADIYPLRLWQSDFSW